jgi:elongation factor G
VQPQSETVWRQADRYNVPRICFINKMDRVGANFFRATDSIARRLNTNPVAIQIPIGSEDEFRGVIDLVGEKAFFFEEDGPAVPREGPVPEEMIEEFRNYRNVLVEKVAETDDELIIKYLEDEEISKEEIKRALRRATLDYKVVPVLCGTALRNRGIQPLIEAIGDYLPSPLDVPPTEGKDYSNGEPVERHPSDPDTPFAALAFKTVSDPYIGRLVYFRAYSGSAASGSMVFNATKGRRERLGRLVQMHANRREEIEEVKAGQIVAAVGLKTTTTGDTICGSRDDAAVLETITFPDPVVSVAIEPRSRTDQDRLSDSLIHMSDEDPTFRVAYDDETGQTIISGMGELHLDIIVDRIRREYNVEANVGRPRVAYRETVTGAARAEGRFVRQTGGHGQFGHVWMEIEPLERGGGIQFESKVSGGAIPTEFIPAVEEGARQALASGPISGFPVVDAKLTLIDGSYHEVDSSKISFLIAGSMAAKSLLTRGRPTLLEPVMKLEVVTPGEFLGDVLGDLGRRRGQIRNIEGVGDVQSVRAEIPLAESFGYANAIRSLTQGRASYTMEFDNYVEVPRELVESV